MHTRNNISECAELIDLKEEVGLHERCSLVLRLHNPYNVVPNPASRTDYNVVIPYKFSGCKLEEIFTVSPEDYLGLLVGLIPSIPMIIGIVPFYRARKTERPSR